MNAVLDVRVGVGGRRPHWLPFAADDMCGGPKLHSRLARPGAADDLAAAASAAAAAAACAGADAAGPAMHSAAQAADHARSAFAARRAADADGAAIHDAAAGLHAAEGAVQSYCAARHADVALVAAARAAAYLLVRARRSPAAGPHDYCRAAGVVLSRVDADADDIDVDYTEYAARAANAAAAVLGGPDAAEDGAMAAARAAAAAAHAAAMCRAAGVRMRGDGAVRPSALDGGAQADAARQILREDVAARMAAGAGAGAGAAAAADAVHVDLAANGAYIDTDRGARLGAAIADARRAADARGRTLARASPTYTSPSAAAADAAAAEVLAV